MAYTNVVFVASITDLKGSADTGGADAVYARSYGNGSIVDGVVDGSKFRGGGLLRKAIALTSEADGPADDVMIFQRGTG